MDPTLAATSRPVPGTPGSRETLELRRAGSSPPPAGPEARPQRAVLGEVSGRGWCSPAVPMLLPSPAVSVLAASVLDPTAPFRHLQRTRSPAAAPAPPRLGFFICKAEGPRGWGWGIVVRGTRGVTAGPGCQPLLNPTPATSFRVDKRTLLNWFGGAETLRLWGKEKPSPRRAKRGGGIEGEDRIRLWGIGLVAVSRWLSRQVHGNQPQRLPGGHRAQLQEHLLAPGSRFKVQI